MSSFSERLYEFFHLAVGAVGVTVFIIRFIVDGTRWLSVFYNTSFDVNAEGISNGLIVIGVLSLLYVFAGGYVIGNQTKQTLRIHLAITAIVFVAYMCLTVWMFQIASSASSWEGNQLSANNHKEIRFGRQFNYIYCKAQQDYICNRATLNEVLETDFAKVILANATTFDADSVVVQPCLTRYGITASKVPPAILQICAYCLDSATKVKFRTISKWANKKCEFEASTFNWCEKSDNGIMYSTNNDVSLDSEFKDAPYSYCHDDLLGHVGFWSVLGGGMTMAAVVCLVCISYVLIRRLRPTDTVQESLPYAEMPLTPPILEPVGYQTTHTPPFPEPRAKLAINRVSADDAGSDEGKKNKLFRGRVLERLNEQKDRDNGSAV